MTLAEFAAPLGELHPIGGGWCTTCPACGGKGALLLGRDVGGQLLARCLGGCGRREVLAARERLVEEQAQAQPGQSSSPERVDARRERMREVGRAGARARWRFSSPDELDE